MSTTKCRCYIDIIANHSGVTGSNFLLYVKLPDGREITGIVDLGLFQEKKWEIYNSKLLFKPSEIDFALVTHVHVDHIGRLPLLAKYNYLGKVYCSEDTAKLLPIALYDSQKVLRTKAKRNNWKSVYDEQDVMKICKSIVGMPYNEPFMVHENVRVTLLYNGHLQGAAMILVQIVDDSGKAYINMLFTGDYCPKNMFFDVLPVPQWVRNLPITIICESTYGDIDAKQQVKCFCSNIKKSVENGDSILIPAFSLGRVQEILYTLKSMQENDSLKKSIPIYLDGNLAVKYTRLFKSGCLCLNEKGADFLPENFQIIGNGVREEIMRSKNQKIIVTTSGMGSYGPAQSYIPYFLGRTKSLIHFTGYCAEGTFGRKLIDTRENEFVTSGDGGGTLAIKRSRVESTSEFSAHAKADQLIKLLKKFNNLNSVILNHGAEEVKLKFAKRVFEEVECSKVGIINREEGFRIGQYGIVKNLNLDLRA